MCILHCCDNLRMVGFFCLSVPLWGILATASGVLTEDALFCLQFKNNPVLCSFKPICLWYSLLGDINYIYIFFIKIVEIYIADLKWRCGSDDCRIKVDGNKAILDRVVRFFKSLARYKPNYTPDLIYTGYSFKVYQAVYISII